MCGRYSFTLTRRQLHALYRLAEPPEAPPDNQRPRYNVAPTEMMPIVLQGRQRRGTLDARWSMIPPWVAALSDIRLTTFNARADGLAASRLYAPSFETRRCIVPATGWHEWQTVDKVKTPYHIADPAGAPLSFAGLWSRWVSPEGGGIFSFAIVTTEASPQIAHLHARMPVLLAAADFETWLTGPAAAAGALLRPYAGTLAFWEIDAAVGNVRNDTPALLEPVRRLV